jgi:hypothetical protein
MGFPCEHPFAGIGQRKLHRRREAQLGETLRLWRDDIDLGAATQRPANLTGREAVDNGRVRMREIGRIEIASSATMLANIVTSGGRGA